MYNIIFNKNNQFKYKQIYEYFKREIELGSRVKGDKLPSKRSLSLNLSVSINTVEYAYNQLVDEGYLYTIEKKGYFVEDIDNLYVRSNDISLSIRKKDKEELSLYKYDFSFFGVDKSYFPWNTFKKLSREVFDENKDDILESFDSKGHIYLRKSIARYLAESRGFLPKSRNIIIDSSTDDIMQKLFLLFPNKYIYSMENPGFIDIYNLSKDLFKDMKAVDIDEDGIIIDKLNKSGSNIVFTTPSHQFPKGIIYPVSRRLELLNWASKKDRYIIEDDYDSEFKYSYSPVPSLKSLDRLDNVIYIGNFSKSISPSIRITYMVLPDSLIDSWESRNYFSCNVSLSTQLLIAKFIDGGYYNRHLNRMRKIYKRKRELLVGEIKDIKHAKIKGTKAGFHIILALDKGINLELLINRLKKRSVRLYSVNDYLIYGSEYNELLIGFSSIDESNIIEGCKIIKEEINIIY